MSKRIRVLVVDDSAFMRKSISYILESSGEIEVVGTARNGQEGFELVQKLKPDIVTLDVEMPVMNGLDTLKKIMTECPTPVIMLSSLTAEGTETTLKALSLGAVDFLTKDVVNISSGLANIQKDLIAKIKTIHNQRALAFRLSRIHSKITEPKGFKAKPQLDNFIKPPFDIRAILIGISTGGPLSLQKVIPEINKNLPVPVFIVQHMPPMFTKSLADRLDKMSSITVKEAEDNDQISPSTVYIGVGGKQMIAEKKSALTNIKITDKPTDTLYKPCVDVTLNSLIDIYGKHVLSIIMTGMGKDGYEATKRLKSLGGYSVAQDEDSCVVFGMPKAIVENNLADAILPLDSIAEQINKLF
jgi:two-component system chemotaxis response regulator CheB